MTALTNLKDLKWGVERRLEFIEFSLYWEGGVNRADIVEQFGVSVPQASKDLSLYQDKAADNIYYDRSQKRYLTSEKFDPKFIVLDATAYLRQLNSATCQSNGMKADWVSQTTSADLLPIPQRHIDPDILRLLLEAVRTKQSIKILYQSTSASRPDPEWRRVSPHSFASDGLRWHTRAFCHQSNKFKDFILSRCMGANELAKSKKGQISDFFWERYFNVILQPNPQLSENQQRVIALDYEMGHNQVEVLVRYALLYYFSKRLRLDVAEQFDDPREVPVIVKNREAFETAMSEAMS
jgi:predicted DNA-binding transcriptional regulator YafY